MDAKMMKKLAEQFDALAETITAIGGTFRAAAEGGDGGAGDGAAEKPVRGRNKPASRPAAKEAPKAAEVTEDLLREALKDLAASKGKEKVAEALAEVGAGRLSEVGEDDYQTLLDAIVKLAADGEDEPAPKAKPKAKKPAAPDYDAVEEKFKELLAADKAKAKEVLTEAGLKRLSEVDKEDEGALTDLLTAITAALEDEDDMV